MSTTETSASKTDAFRPRQPAGMGKGLLLALFAHSLLIGALALGLRWKASDPAGIEAELWAAVPQAAAPRAAAPEPAPVPPKPVEAPPPTPAPAPPPPPAKVEPTPQQIQEAEIAIEKARVEKERLEKVQRAKEEDERKKKEQLAKEEADRKKKEQLAKEEADRKKKEQLAKEEAERKKSEQLAKDEAERKKKEQLAKEEAARKKKEDQAQAKALDEARERNLARIQGEAGATGAPTDRGTAARAAGPSAGYAGRIRARIQPNIVFADVVTGNPMATVEVRLASDGTIVSRKLVKSSGLNAWDEAVLRAIDKTEVLPRDTDGRVPSVMEIAFRPHD